ncbi:unnamed protein product [Mytilus edulis]|uniref:Uncharacterized protein n=1 Tax=Mytilus edulis TaxID=6550 RepID=A0A8S3R7U6_MYTED|nr:unnamed protein product [Mytilus edulis]
MDTKLKAIRSGHKGAITRLWKNFGDIRDTSEIEIEDVTAILDSVLQKRDILKDLNDKIVDASSDEDVVDEIQQTDEYMFDLDSKIRQIRKLINPSQSKSHNLPVNTTVFQASNVTPSDTPMHTLISPTANSIPASDSSQLNPHANCFTSTSHVQSNAASFYTSNPAISEIIPTTNPSMHIPRPLQPGRVLSSTTSSILNVLVSNKSEEFGLEEIIKEQTRCQIIERVEEAEPTGKISKDGLNDTYLLNCCDLLWTVTKIFDLLTYFQKPIT